jgi:hypothetical protein
MPSLRPGCYLLRYTPKGTTRELEGTLRVERDDVNTIASGDLYLHRPGAPRPDPAAGIPIFPLKQYRHYMRVTKILEGAAEAERFPLDFELHRYDRKFTRFVPAGAFHARMAFTDSPDGFPSDFLRGDVRDADGDVVGTLTMGWISPHLRRATIEIDRVAGCERPLANSAGLEWHDVFEQVGWHVSVLVSDSDVEEPDEPWTKKELHAAIKGHRDSVDLDREWRYWLVCVKHIDEAVNPRGVMFDDIVTDSNHVPREGAAIAADWMVTDAPLWGHAAGLRFGTVTDAYFRAAVHEIGHAMGLAHNLTDTGFMNTTETIAGRAQLPQQFPENIQWSFAPIDAERLRHLPDMTVRPGGVPWRPLLDAVPISAGDDEPDGVELEVEPLLTAVPIGAPVRVELRLSNRGDGAIPADLSLDAGFVSGTVTDPSGTTRSFGSLLACADGQRLADADLVPGSMTLLRGGEGALFPLPGAHTVDVDVRWDLDGVPMRVSGSGAVMVTAAVDSAHAAAALAVLTAPDALLTLALGGDHLPEGQAAIATALECEVLRPHFAYVEAKRVARPFFDRPADLERAAALIGGGAVMSSAEADKARGWMAYAPAG